MLRRTVLLLCVSLSVAAPAGAQRPDAAASDEALVLRAGDAIRISVWRKPELSGEFFVASDGSVADPFYSAVKVADIPFATAEARVREYVALIEASPRIWVEPLFRVSVGGEVREPNIFSVRRETTISQAVAQAGGATPNGSMRRVRLNRGGQVYDVDLTDPADPLAASRVRSGDELTVMRQRNVFRDFIAPSASVVAATAALINVLLR